MAPEQLEGQEADARTDIFAFGALLYEMLTGRRAFDGKTQASLIAAIMFEADPAKLKYYFASPTRYKGKGCVVSRTGYTGEDGLEIMTRDNVYSMRVDNTCDAGFPEVFGFEPTPLEAVVPTYVAGVTPRLRYNWFRFRARR